LHTGAAWPVCLAPLLSARKTLPQRAAHASDKHCQTPTHTHIHTHTHRQTHHQACASAGTDQACARARLVPCVQLHSPRTPYLSSWLCITRTAYPPAAAHSCQSSGPCALAPAAQAAPAAQRCVHTAPAQPPALPRPCAPASAASGSQLCPGPAVHAQACHRGRRGPPARGAIYLCGLSVRVRVRMVDCVLW